jgi:hypothetical protein
LHTEPKLLLEPELTELFQANPKELSDADFAKLISHYRAERKQWVDKEAKPKKGSAAPDLSDLGL